ncbi:Irc21p KNAG_0C05780 [Huiozyma naganishii CBS 8797]|uniref:Cytochrome b5 heme-binding domain-containing protein n=1 Tax=Huiozyma naganishii (strain ATCC MYA-139 / BCRC 22969 / CBS 8797 / KCTC 17520 / NBRC 10181 / NCYC 3082 / Yp74L-3) TaxID=1071383 RepID=J7S6C6_HUIN7|nr:hypothetical protein KNAG_0C05780 [Kazachstania naganishii CBS 8797]CCK69676.1 hypothetical protein KNAG_0C05780 [Kazachstania naganishii CBS 8797]
MDPPEIRKPSVRIVTNGSNALPNRNNTGTAKRKKVRLQPGHSALDWSHKVVTDGAKGLLITGLDTLVQDSEFQRLNAGTVMNQVAHRIPTYKIRPLMAINSKILKNHQDYLSKHDFWAVYKGKVYCLSYYLDFHPGGIEIIIDHATRDPPDIRGAFDRYHRWVSAEKLLETCLVGKYVED